MKLQRTQYSHGKNTKYISEEHKTYEMGQGGIPLNLGQQNFWGKEGQSVAAIKEINQNVVQT